MKDKLLFFLYNNRRFISIVLSVILLLTLGLFPTIIIVLISIIGYDLLIKGPKDE